MMLRRLAVASVAFTAACTPLQKQATGPAAQSVRVTNQLPFDIAVCQAAVPVPPPTDPNVLVGALAAARPYVMECLVAPTSRGAEKASRVVLKANVSDQEAKHTLTAENLTPEGEACVRKAVETAVPLAPFPKGTRPVSAEVDFTHEQGRSLAVTLGTDAASDYSGAVRLGQPQWCDCYAPFATQVPPQLEATVKLTQGQATPTEVAFKPVGTPEGDALAACLQQKMMALPVGATKEAVQFTRVFNHFNSRATTPPAATLMPEVRFLQGELVRQQLSSEGTIAYGARIAAADAFDAAMVKQQKTKDKKAAAAEVATRCTALVEADAKWVASLEAQLQANQNSLALAQELKAKDAAAWTPAESSIQEAVASLQQELTNARNQSAADQQACPKTGK